MKTLHVFLLFAIFGLALSSESLEYTFTPIEKKCAKEVDVELQTVVDNMIDDVTMTEGNHKINEFIECVVRKYNIIDENNEIKYDEYKQLLIAYLYLYKPNIADNQVISHAMEACKSVVGDDLGDRLVRFGNCVLKQTTL